MKKYLIILIAAIPFLESFKCGKTNDYFDPAIPVVMLKTTINNSNENIKLGDTLKFTLTVPDSIKIFNKLTGDSSKIAISSVQECMYNFDFYFIDTSVIGQTTVAKMNSPLNTFVTIGSIISSSSVFTTTGTKPFKSELNIVAPKKGLYYIDFGRQETTMKVNNSFRAGLRVNMDVPDKHWTLFEPFNPGYINSSSNLNIEGYGRYCFRVN